MEKRKPSQVLLLVLGITLVLLSACSNYAQPGMQIWLDYPQEDISISAGDIITVQAHARDQNGPGIGEIQFLADGIQIGAVTTTHTDPIVQVGASWQPVAGDYQLVARAVSQSGGTVDSLPVRVVVAGTVVLPPLDIITPSFTPTVTITRTPEPPVPVSNGVFIIPGQNTYCRTGPEQVYPAVATINAGVQVQATARYPAANYYVVKNPFSSGECWIWGQGATIIGPVETLPIAVPPPRPITDTPTPTLTFTPTATRTPTLTVTSPPPLITFYIRNDFASHLITEVYLSASGGSDWGPDLLSGSISPGATKGFSITEGLYNVKVYAVVEPPGNYYYLNNQILENNVVLVFGP